MRIWACENWLFQTEHECEYYYHKQRGPNKTH
jgi:hypothetical protein